MTSVDAEIEKAKEEESKTRKEQEDINMEDLLEEVNDPDNPIPTIEGFGPRGSSKKKKKKKTKSTEDDDEDSDKDSDEDSDDDDNDEDNDIEEEEDVYPDLINHDEIRKGRGLTTGKCISWTKVGSYRKRPVV